MNESEARQVLFDHHIERDIADVRSCVQIVEAMHATGGLAGIIEVTPVPENHTPAPTPHDQRERGSFFVPYAGL